MTVSADQKLREVPPTTGQAIRPEHRAEAW
jgi:hypothetical protein